MIRIDAVELVDAIRQVAAENPNEFVNVCQYFGEHGYPICIVGQAMARLGIDKNVFLESLCVNDRNFKALCQENQPPGRYEQIIQLINDPNGVYLNWISAVQSAQDGGIVWSTSVALADDTQVFPVS